MARWVTEVPLTTLVGQGADTLSVTVDPPRGTDHSQAAPVDGAPDHHRQPQLKIATTDLGMVDGFLGWARRRCSSRNGPKR